MKLNQKIFFRLPLSSILLFFNIAITSFLVTYSSDFGVAQIFESGEDRFKHEVLSSGLEFCAVYDGHRNFNCVEYIERRVHRIFERIDDEEASSTSEKIRITIHRTDNSWLSQDNSDNSGSTAVVALINSATDELTLSNTGDSRAILVRNGSVLFSTKDHDPEDPDEYRRITEAGGRVIDGRIDGNLGMSRALGNKDLKRWVIPDPDVTNHSLENGDLIILASDGLWSKLSNSYVARFVQERLETENLNTIARQLAIRAEDEGSSDDITVLIYRYNKINSK